MGETGNTHSLAKRCRVTIGAPVIWQASATDARDGDFPVTPSGGLLGVGNPIAAAAGMKSAEVYLQLTGKAGKRQIDGRDVTRGLAQAWGDLMQVGTVLVMKGGRVE